MDAGGVMTEQTHRFILLLMNLMGVGYGLWSLIGMNYLVVEPGGRDNEEPLTESGAPNSLNELCCDL